MRHQNAPESGIAWFGTILPGIPARLFDTIDGED